jgi:hypothetical protein
MDPLITLEPIRHVDVTNSTQNAPLVPRLLKTTLQIYSQLRFCLWLAVVCYCVASETKTDASLWGTVKVQIMIFFFFRVTKRVS